jgi:hypothetical protein
MIAIAKKIQPGEGLGDLKFGMTREQVTAVLGKPTESEIYSYTDDDSNMTDSWHYDDLDLSLSFDEEENWRLVSLAVSGEEYTLEGISFVGMGKDEVILALKELEIEDLDEEEWSDEEEESQVMISCPEIEVTFWLIDNAVTEVQWNPFYVDEETIDWPA